MNFLAIFFPIFFVLFLVIPFICFIKSFEFKGLRKLYPERDVRRRNRRASSHFSTINQCGRDRQGNIFTITDESGATRNYADFFVVEPNADDARVRAQLEKDDKDLPTYDEVMAATLAASAASYAAARQDFDSPTRSANSNTTIDINSPSSTNIPIDVPPYSEVDPNPLTPVTATSNQNADTTITLPTIGSTSTCDALQIVGSNTNLSGSTSTESAVRSVGGNPSNESHIV